MSFADPTSAGGVAGSARADPAGRAGAGTQDKADTQYNPDTFRMTLGEHLEELRKRIIYGLIGLFTATIACMAVGETVMAFLTQPLLTGLRNAGLNPQAHSVELTAGFMTYLKLSLIMAMVISGPWMLYQLWLFVAAGLYPSERKVVTKYIPLSVTLFILGCAVAYYPVMPITVKFLLGFNSSFTGLNLLSSPKVDVAPEQVVKVPMLQGDPSSLSDGQIWFNQVDGRLKFTLHGLTRVIDFGPDSMLSTKATLETYIDLTLTTVLVFGVAFQLPLVVLALFKVGLFDVQTLRRSRRIVYFTLSIVAAVLAPGDVVSAMMALYIPLILLYEFGILLCAWSAKKAA